MDGACANLRQIIFTRDKMTHFLNSFFRCCVLQMQIIYPGKRLNCCRCTCPFVESFLRHWVPATFRRPQPALTIKSLFSYLIRSRFNAQGFVSLSKFVWQENSLGQRRNACVRTKFSTNCVQISYKLREQFYGCYRHAIYRRDKVPLVTTSPKTSASKRCNENADFTLEAFVQRHMHNFFSVSVEKSICEVSVGNEILSFHCQNCVR